MVTVPGWLLLLIGGIFGFVLGILVVVLAALKYKDKEDKDGGQGV